MNDFRCLLVSDFTIGGLAPFLATTADAPALNATIAPFGQVTQTLVDADLDCWRPSPLVTVVWTRPQGAIGAFARLLDGEQVPPDDILAEVDRFAAHLRAAARRTTALLVPTWTWPSYDRGRGVLNFDLEMGPSYHLLRMNARLAEAVASESNIHLLDAARWVAQVGPTASSPKLWYLGKIAFSPDVFKHAAFDIKAATRTFTSPPRKLVALDLDDTLWGGVVGEVGWEHLNLGGHEPAGEAFRAFQGALKALTRRGIVLAIVSKNTESVALEAIDRHPEMILRREDFVAWRINWDDKAANLAALAREVNIGLDAIVFIDDSKAERARVREALPEVLVPDWPSDKLLYDKALAELTCFDSRIVTDEDRVRTRMYVAERERDALKASVQTVDQYLASLSLEVSIGALDGRTLMRATQLLNKTNQMNLATRRMVEADFMGWAAVASHAVHVFRVRDRFDDYGLTGIASLSLDGDSAHIEDFLLSCRTIGRGVEQVMLHALAERARMLNATRLVAMFQPTSRNAPCQAFFAKQSGFEPLRDGQGWAWDLSKPYPAPQWVTLRGEHDDPA